MLDYRLKTFLSLCRILNYTKTAEELHITQPAVSQHIKHLEEDYGVKLFDYQGKNLQLTKEGEILYRFSLSMAASSDKIRSILSKPKDRNLPLRFGSTLTIGEYTMSKLLKRLIKDFPSIDINMQVGNTETLLKMLEDGKIDFAILEGHFDKSEYESILFSEEAYIGVVSPRHELGKKEVSFEDLFNNTLILREKGSGTRDILERILYEHNHTMASFSKTIEIGNMHLIKELVKADLGLTFLYKEAVEKELKDGQLVEINLKGFQIQRDFNFVYLKNSLHHKEYLAWLKYFLEIK